MKTAFIILFSITLLNSYITNVFCQTSFEKYSSKETLIDDVKKIISDFDKFMKENCVIPPDIPSVEIKTTYSLIYWDGAKKSVVLPYWDELYPCLLYTSPSPRD